MEPLLSKAIEDYVENCTSPVPPLLEKLEKETFEKMDDPEMLSGRVEGRLLQILIKISAALYVVELGTYTGYSALMMAEALPANGKIITCEISQERADFAQRYFDQSPHGKKIILKLGPAMETLKTIQVDSIDLIFIDADKIHYSHYYEESFRIIKNGGLIVVDNALWSGQVLNPQDEDSQAIAQFNETVSNDDRVEKVMLTVRDGIYIIRKL